MNSFLIPPDIEFEADSLDYLKGLEGKRAVLVTGGSSMKKFGFLDKAAGFLEEAGLESIVVDGVEPNPSVETVERGKEAMLDFEPDWVIAIGGGSALDAAKIMWVFYEHPKLNFEDIIEVGSIPKLRQKAKFIAIPSTSGTASEITAFSVITDTKKKIKYPIVSPEIIPDIAIIDPKIPTTMPAHITANTGMDVMAHAVESFVSTGASDYTDPLALRAIDLVFKYLPAAVEDGDNLDAREKMHNASTMAGMAFSNSSLGIIHSLAHKIGGELHITHGLANAVLLPYVIEFNYEAAKDKFEYVENFIGVDSLADAIRELNKNVGIVPAFKDIDWLDFTADDFEVILDRMSQNALEDPCTLTNPKQPTVEDMKEIYKKSFYGK
ncbi:iron-containing alcohol dehydrogenase [Halanaerobium congolense]|jgi:alcohol dehydrogenase class IV|uniref:Alcohol dehydrogenase class IV n=1 Tax=Halanaerobium congolense TaxID=54121 RepID=A0A1G6SY54_9FIRM|nr:iron-containing alcohol dehydrogenase [Halanaerobium congolense]PUU91518.1 MAG: alcohol dehydrogenase, class IV [Halanaerobium sp.]TDS26647.1 alcohol dehydrogenase class IV [Halanaerobium congolense]SDD21723.1 Alcohol dehydrogenase, class IV [Halanaerobium congolense]SDM84861.1 Alcohol dehydrogenase, class IV [Halanaerobium congolense]